MAILGELPLAKGKRDVSGSIAYVPQASWILPTSLQENVLFTKEMNKIEYNTVMHACCLNEVSVLFSFITFHFLFIIVFLVRNYYESVVPAFSGKTSLAKLAALTEDLRNTDLW